MGKSNLCFMIFSAPPEFLNCEFGVKYAMIGDGYCNDETNNAHCNYDGGDCCGTCVATDHCSECECLGGVKGNGASNVLIGNGYCNDELHNVECRYDGGDCCPKPNLVGNGICNDETNIGTCSFDGGDCCLSSPNSEFEKTLKISNHYNDYELLCSMGVT